MTNQPRGFQRYRDSYGYTGGQLHDVKLNIHRTDTKDHQCDLSGEPRDVVAKFIDSGMFVHSRRTIKRFMMINTNHPYTKYYAPSIKRQQEEEYRHLAEYYYRIHPLSMFTFYFEMLLCFVILCMAVVYPIILMSFRKERGLLYVIFIPINALYILMILVNFCSGYYDIKKNTVGLKFSDLIAHYASTYFIFDILTVLPQFLRSEKAAVLGVNYDLKDAPTILRIVAPSLILLSYVRYFWCLRTLQQMRLYFEMSTYKFKIVRLVLNFLTIIIISIYILFSIMHEIPGYVNNRVLKHVENTLKMILMVSYGHPVFKQSKAALFPTIFILIGFTLHLVVLVLGTEIWLKYSSVDNRENTVSNSTKAYMRYKALPLMLRKRIYLFLDFKYQGHFFKESVIRRATSAALRREILITITKKSIQKVELFKHCPGLVLNKIRANLVSDIYLPGDVIIKAGSEGHCMFLILAGTVVVTSPEDKLLCTLRDGEHFGEVALVTNISRVANVTAETPCELFKLERTHFWEVMKSYPQIWQDIQNMTSERMVKTRSSIGDESIRRDTFRMWANQDRETLDFQVAHLQRAPSRRPDKK